MDKVTTEYTPDFVSPPGETLEEVLDERGMTRRELAKRTGLATKTISQIITGNNALTPTTALKLERALGIPANFWNRREESYQEFLAREKEREKLKKSVEWLRELPIREMIKFKWINKLSDPIEQLREVLNFFGVVDVQQWQETYENPQGAYRQSKAFRSQPGPLSVWLRKGELSAGAMEVAEYNRNHFEEILLTIRSMTDDLPRVFVPKMQKLCASAGVAVIFVPELTGSRVSGVTRWLSKNPCIQLSLRYKTNDHLWFTFFHEAAHILKHGKKEVFLEVATGNVEGEKELEANQWATDFLIPPLEYQRLTFLGKYSSTKIQAFAIQVGVAPGIVVGRLQHDKLLPFTHLNGLKEKYTWTN
jgi:addiction module HigA family antidote